MTDQPSTPEGPVTDASIDDDGSAERRRPMAPWVVLVIALAVGGLFVLLAGSESGGRVDTADTPLLGRVAPEIAGTTLSGDEFALSRRRGSWVVLNFFNTSCVPCVREHPELMQFVAAEEARADGAELVTIMWGNDTAGTLRSFFAENGGGTWPVVLDDGGSAVDYGVAKVPETWVIDPNGIVRLHVISEVDALSLGAAVEQLRTAVVAE